MPSEIAVNGETKWPHDVGNLERIRRVLLNHIKSLKQSVLNRLVLEIDFLVLWRSSYVKSLNFDWLSSGKNEQVDVSLVKLFILPHDLTSMDWIKSRFIWVRLENLFCIWQLDIFSIFIFLFSSLLVEQNFLDISERILEEKSQEKCCSDDNKNFVQVNLKLKNYLKVKILMLKISHEWSKYCRLNGAPSYSDVECKNRELYQIDTESNICRNFKEPPFECPEEKIWNEK